MKGHIKGVPFVDSPPGLWRCTRCGREKVEGAIIDCDRAPCPMEWRDKTKEPDMIFVSRASWEELKRSIRRTKMYIRGCFVVSAITLIITVLRFVTIGH